MAQLEIEKMAKSNPKSNKVKLDWFPIYCAKT